MLGSATELCSFGLVYHISTCLYKNIRLHTNWDKAAKKCRDKRSRDALLTQNVNMTLGTCGCDQCMGSVGGGYVRRVL